MSHFDYFCFFLLLKYIKYFYIYEKKAIKDDNMTVVIPKRHVTDPWLIDQS